MWSLMIWSKLGQVLEEGLRKYPVAPAPSRVLAKDITVGGYHIPKGNGINSLQIFFFNES